MSVINLSNRPTHLWDARGLTASVSHHLAFAFDIMKHAHYLFKKTPKELSKEAQLTTTNKFGRIPAGNLDSESNLHLAQNESRASFVVDVPSSVSMRIVLVRLITKASDRTSM